MWKFSALALGLCLTPVLAGWPPFPSQNSQDLRQEEEADYYRKWLEEDVVYIISSEERAVFEKLTTPEEKDQFIEQFWFRRDPDPRTPTNEFKEEHYRRIAYANEKFKSGLAGWKTDRGRIYIIWGPPDQVEAYPTGGNYERQPHEGGGFTSVYPFERWWYRHLPGVGSDIELEFVDPHFSNEYYLAANPEEKDALLNVPGLGPTWAEEFGLRDKKDRPYFVSNYGEDSPWINYRAKDSPFRRYETYFQVQQPAPIKYQDLRELVEVNVTYDSIPFQVRRDYFRLNDRQVLAPVTLLFQNKDLTFKPEAEGHTAKLAIYGLVTTLTQKVVTEFEDDVILSYREGELEQGLLEQCIYQKLLSVDRSGRYRLDLVVKDLHSGKVGVARTALLPPDFDGERLRSSSLVLSGWIRTLTEVPEGNPMFVLGDVWIRPSMDLTFYSNDPLGIYLQVYNAGLDQARQLPALKVHYRILRDGEAIWETVHENGESIQYFSEQRIVLIHAMPLQELEEGQYTAELTVQDQIRGQSLKVAEKFKIGGPSLQLARQR